MISYKKNLEKGFTLIEAVFYVALFVIISIAIIDAILGMTRFFKETKIQIDVAQGGDIMERISREIRQSGSISAISSSDLVLNTKDSNGNNETIEFASSGANLQFYENGNLIGNLNSSNITVSNLSFTSIITAQSAGVKVSFSVYSNNDSLKRAYDFYDTAVLRDSY